MPSPPGQHEVWADEAAGIVLCPQDMLTVTGILADDSIDAIVTDPPYGLAELPRKRVEQAIAAWLAGDRSHVPDGRGFMGREWDKFVPPPAAWDECYRVLKPGGWLLAFAAPRTQDLMGLSIRLAGFALQDGISWWFGQGFPKVKSRLKPAYEPIVVARKAAKRDSPFPGLDGCKVTTAENLNGGAYSAGGRAAKMDGDDREGAALGLYEPGRRANGEYEQPAGRWPPNLLLTHSAGCVPAGVRDVASNGHHPAARGPGGVSTSGHGGQTGLEERKSGTETVTAWDCESSCPVALLDAQSPDRPRFFPQLYWSEADDAPFMYQAKAPKSERPQVDGVKPHCTVKPLALMRWLVRLVTPPGGIVADFFAGTGTTLQAAKLEGFRAIGSENDPDACALARKRLGLGEFAVAEAPAGGQLSSPSYHDLHITAAGIPRG